MNIPLPDFDVLVALHQHDPEALEDFRRHTLRKAVDFAPLEHRASLENLLKQIESAREQANSPMEAATIAFRLMQDSVTRLHQSWDDAREAVAGLQTSLIIERLRGTRTLRLVGGNAG
jgi:transposase-like protein